VILEFRNQAISGCLAQLFNGKPSDRIIL